MDINALYLIIVILAVLNVIQLLVIYKQNGKLGDSYPAEVKTILAALVGLAAAFAAKTPTQLDDDAIKQVLMPVLQLLGVTIPDKTDKVQ